MEVFKRLIQLKSNENNFLRSPGGLREESGVEIIEGRSQVYNRILFS